MRNAMDAKLIRQGEPIDALTFVLDGKVSVEVEGIGQVASLGSGEMLGEPVCVIRAQRPVQVGPAKFRVIAAAVAAWQLSGVNPVVLPSPVKLHA